MSSVSLLGAPRSVDGQLRRARLGWMITYAAVCGVGLVIAAFAYTRWNQPYVGISAAAVATLVVMWFARPRATMALTVGLTMIGDIVTVSWFPFAKNLSSRESILYVADSVSLSPLEVSLVTGVIAMSLRLASEGAPLLRRRALDIPIAGFSVFVVLAFARGLGAGADLRIALIEGRGLLYLPLVYVLVGMVCRTRRDLNLMVGAAIVGILVQSLLSIEYYARIGPTEQESLESLTEHGSAIGMAFVILLFVAAFALDRIPLRVRLGLLVTVVPVGYVFLLSQRRAGVVALGAATILLAITLLWRQPRTFAKVVPPSAAIITGYVLAFWNSTSVAGFPAQAVKSVVAPNQLSEEDRSSDLYRIIESYDLWYTIRSAPAGLGFGRPFLRPVPLPDISAFELNAYLPHNSMLWLWIKVGYVGFALFFYIVARSLNLAARRLRSAPHGTDTLVTFGAAGVVTMYVIFTYVDVSWDVRNMVLLPLALSVCVFPATPTGSEAATADAADTADTVDTDGERVVADSPVDHHEIRDETSPRPSRLVSKQASGRRWPMAPEVR